jgi:hypothetical protein
MHGKQKMAMTHKEKEELREAYYGGLFVRIGIFVVFLFLSVFRL